MTKAQSTLAAFLFILGLGFIILGTTSHAEATMWSLSLPIWLAKAVGLITILGSLITFLALYGSSLPPTRRKLEGRTERANLYATKAATQPHVTRTEEPYRRRAKPDAPRSLVSLARTSTEARMLLAIEKKKKPTHHPSSSDGNNKTAHVERTLYVV
jgi:hypothetical protein